MTWSEYLRKSAYKKGLDAYKNEGYKSKKSYDITDSDGNIIGRLDKGWRVPDHVHMF